MCIKSEFEGIEEINHAIFNTSNPMPLTVTVHVL
jgi:hypothetical protein